MSLDSEEANFRPETLKPKLSNTSGQFQWLGGGKEGIGREISQF